MISLDDDLAVGGIFHSPIIKPDCSLISLVFIAKDYVKQLGTTLRNDLLSTFGTVLKGTVGIGEILF